MVVPLALVEWESCAFWPRLPHVKGGEITARRHAITVLGGAGSAVLEIIERQGLPRRTLQLGLPDRFIDHGDPARLLKDCGLDADGIHRSIAQFIAE